MDYRQVIDEDLDLYARISYDQTVHHATGDSNGYYQNDTRMTITAHKAFPHENLSLSVSGSYALVEVSGSTGNVYTVNPSLRWHVGQARCFWQPFRRATAITTGRNGKLRPSEEDAYYLTVSRQIF